MRPHLARVGVDQGSHRDLLRDALPQVDAALRVLDGDQHRACRRQSPHPFTAEGDAQHPGRCKYNQLNATTGFVIQVADVARDVRHKRYTVSEILKEAA